MADTMMEIRKLTPTIGAEILGVDLSAPLSNSEFGLPLSRVTAALTISTESSPLCGTCRFGMSPAWP
mgnify:CR=1 FL=1